MFRKLVPVTVAASLALVAVAAPGSSAQSRPARASGEVVHHRHGKGGSPCEGLAGCTFVQLQGDPKTGASEAMFTLKAGTPFSPHWHTSPERVVGVSGVMLWHVKGHKTYRVGAGDYLSYPSKAVHWGKCAPGADCVYYVHDALPYDFHPAGR
ncbi:cupin domain-containing protein [Nonomuraea sp. SMC257]|uniref:Cupin domain-containing protein n=1 Tax=Nonomuraea montanisoli TaxID=2741721 RepID=A0A7Y6I4Y9_9ACTN|nr:cupin domain-containing protein [Nonomuraea montanisoli]NUW31807.1 cupin domain-containing protein [Nonomuraea montanisoli]